MPGSDHEQSDQQTASDDPRWATGEAATTTDDNTGDLDELLSAIDEVLEENAEEFVRNYVQKGGNGGDQYYALFVSWIEALGEQRAYDIVTLLRERTRVEGREAVTLDKLLELRYGSCAATYFDPDSSAINEMLTYIAPMAPVTPWQDTPSYGFYAEELSIRQSAIARHYQKAAQNLHRLLRTGSEQAASLAEEYKHLTTSDLDQLNDPASEACLLADYIEAIRATVVSWTDDREIVIPSQPTRPASRHSEQDVTTVADIGGTSAERGDSLEHATVRLFERLFQISPDNRGPMLRSLRRQSPGPQYGSDIHFTASTRGIPPVRCHVECKNYSKSITLRDIADKVLQTDDTDADIDHWILISPHVDPSNEVERMVARWNDRRRFGFRVHVWSPQHRVQELFAIEPIAFEAVYGQQQRPFLTNEGEVVAAFKSQLTPYRRVDRSLIRYIEEPQRICFAHEDSDHLESLLGDSVELRAVDILGRPITSITHFVEQWIADSDRDLLLILGEFGDGKSFFTYKLARSLGDAFIAPDSESDLFPLRLPLADLNESDNPRAFLHAHLSALGSSIDHWLTLASSYRTLLILDGFDEMTSSIDDLSVSRNLDRLSDLIEFAQGTSTSRNAGSKVIVTSRSHYLDEPRHAQLIRERLGDPVITRLAPIRRSEVLANLAEFARRTGTEDKLRVIRNLYDPIGLSTKPLFLEMVKSTLHELPHDTFDSTTLYERYASKSLRRKARLLRPSMSSMTESNVIRRLERILEAVAVEWQRSGDDWVDLRSVETAENRDMASLLWDMSQNITTPASELAAARGDVVQDARARVSIRSLLSSKPSADGRLLVKFFHRSMAEFFVARVIAAGLNDDTGRSLEHVLGMRPVSREAMNFAREVADPTEDSKILLMSLIHGSIRGRRDNQSLGGNSLSLYYALFGSVPLTRGFSGLNLDYVSIPGARLNGCDFRGASLRNATLDNCDLSGADFRDADITGLRVEQTASVLGMDVDEPSGHVFAAYSDGVVRQWTRAGSGHWSQKVVADGIGGGILGLNLTNRGVALVRLRQEVLLYYMGADRWNLVGRMAASPFLVGASVDEHGHPWVVTRCVGQHHASMWLTSLHDEGVWQREVDRVTARHLRIDEFNEEPLGRLTMHGPWATSATSPSDIVSLIGGARVRIDADAPLTALALQHGDGYVRSVLAGTADGDVVVGEAELSIGGESAYRWSSRRAHQGPITAVAMMSDGAYATASVDRSVLVWPNTDAPPETLELSVRCAGIRLDGALPEREVGVLSALSDTTAP